MTMAALRIDDGNANLDDIKLDDVSLEDVMADDIQPAVWEWADDAARAAQAHAIPDEGPARHGRTLAELAILYLRHDNPSRAMVLALAAMTMGDTSPRTLLAAAEAMLRAGDPAQALTVLGRLDDPLRGLVSRAATDTELAARYYIAAKALYRQGDTAAARAALDRSRDLTPTAVSTRAGDIGDVEDDE